MPMSDLAKRWTREEVLALPEDVLSPREVWGDSPPQGCWRDPP